MIEENNLSHEERNKIIIDKFCLVLRDYLEMLSKIGVEYSIQLDDSLYRINADDIIELSMDPEYFKIKKMRQINYRKNIT